MLELTIDEQEIFNERTNEYLYTKKTFLQLEHSLISIHKWESKWHKSFLSTKEKTYEELTDYIRCMTINKVADDTIYRWIPPDQIKQIVEYIQNPMTAVMFRDPSLIGASKRKEQIITAETIYYWMIELNIPVEFERWHLEQLLALIKFINAKHEDPKKRPKNRQEMAAERHRINLERRAKHHSKG